MTDADYRDQLHRVIRLARRRYRWRVLLAGTVIVLAGAAALLVLSAALLEYFRFGPAAITAVRVAFYLGLAALVFRALVVPASRRLSDADIALYIESREPTLQAALVSAVEYEGGMEAASPGLVRRLVREAVERAGQVEDGRRIERKPLRWLPPAGAGALALLLLLALAGPAFVRNAVKVLFMPWNSAEAAVPYAIMVEPGHAVVPRGGDLRIAARLAGFESDQVLLYLRPADSAAADAEWEPAAMGEDSIPRRYLAQLFDLERTSEYYIEANGIRSPVFRLEVRDLPYARTLDLELAFPGYTGLSPQTIENGGDVAALPGTRVTVTVTPTMPAAGGMLVLEGRAPVPLVPADSGRLQASFTVQGNGFYHVQLRGMDSTLVRASLDYAVEALPDQPPLVRIVRPGRDTRVTSLEEVFIEAQGEDDYGVRRLELVFSVNGGPEQVVQLHQSPRRMPEVTAGHTLYLEEYNLEPGDLVSYFARATDANPYGGPGTGATDIYFLQVRPFDREYRQAEQAGMPGQQQQAESPEGLSAMQREIVSATFKAERDRASTPPAALGENLATIALAQGRLREQVETLHRRMVQRGVSSGDSVFAVVAAELPRAVEAMREAEGQLGRRDPAGALPPEQRALQHLQRAEAAYREVQVSMQQQQGGGGGSQSNAEELADLFELENDRNQNQYEGVQRGREEQAQQEVDEVMERLKELASRQQQENERMMREAQRMRQSGGASGGSASQRRLAQEVDSLVRRLERLTREQPSAELQESLRELQEAAAAMRRSASQGGGQGSRALDRLEEARRLLEQGNANRVRENLEQGAQAARRLAEQQRQVAREAAGVSRGDQAARRRLERAKEQMARDLRDLENQLERAARDARDDQREASRQAQEAVNGLRERRVREKIEYSRGLLGSGEPSRQFEETITANLDQLAQDMEEAVQAVGQSPGERTGRALDRARELAQGLESLAERSEQRSEQGGEARSPGAPGPPRQGATPEGGQEDQVAGDAQPGTPGSVQSRGTDARQLNRELRERRMDAERLRQELLQEGVDVADLERIISRMRGLEGRGLGTGDRQTLEILRSEIIAGLKEFEFALRRELAGPDERRPRAGRQGEVAPEYREMVERYYERISE